MIQVRCGGCDKVYAVPEQHAGKKVRCKQCQGIISIPAAARAPEPESEEPEAPSPEEKPASAPAKKPGPRFPAKKGLGAKRTFNPAAAKGISKRTLGAKGRLGARKGLAGSSRLKSRLRPGAEEGAEAAEGAGGGDGRKKLILIGGGVLAAVAIAVVIWQLFLSGPAEEPTTTKRPKEVATKAGTTPEEPGAAAETEGLGGTEVTEEEAGGAGGAMPAVPADSLDVIPADANFIAHVAFGRLSTIPVMAKKIAEAMEQDAELSAFKEETGFDPLARLGTIWVASKLTPESMDAGSAEYLLVLEGMFDEEKMVEGMQAHKMIGDTPRKVGPCDVYPAYEDGQEMGYLTFLDAAKAMIGSDELFNGAIRLLSGGDSIRSNAALKEVSGDFASDKLIWAAFAVPQEVRDALAEKSKEVEESGQPPIPVMEAVRLNADATADGTGLLLGLDVLCASPEETQKAQQWAAGLVMMARLLPLPEEFKPVLSGVKITPADKVLSVLVTIPEKALESLSASSLAGGAGDFDFESELGTDEGVEGTEGIEGAEEGVEEPTMEESEGESLEDSPEEPTEEESTTEEVTTEEESSET